VTGVQTCALPISAVTARYLGVTDEKIEQALDSHVDIIYRPK
jgi:hypothetical protein